MNRQAFRAVAASPGHGGDLTATWLLAYWAVAGAQGKSGPPLRKSLGQHHLRHSASAAPAVDYLDVSGRQVVEIGAGGGVLTRILLERGARRVIACELDLRWTFELGRRLGDSRVARLCADACDLRYERLTAATRIAGNLPYNLATRIVRTVLERSPVGARAAFLVQREVAERLTALPRDSAYGALSVLAASRASVRRLAILPPGSFVPPPAVTSAFVGLERKTPPVDEGAWPAFAAFVGTAFGHRRKTLLNNLRREFGRGPAEQALRRVGLPLRARAEELNVADLVVLFGAVRDLEVDERQ